MMCNDHLRIDSPEVERTGSAEEGSDPGATFVHVLFPTDRMPLPMLAVVLALDFIIGPVGILAGGLFGAAHAESHGTYRSI